MQKNSFANTNFNRANLALIGVKNMQQNMIFFSFLSFFDRVKFIEFLSLNNRLRKSNKSALSDTYKYLNVLNLLKTINQMTICSQGRDLLENYREDFSSFRIQQK